MRYIVFAYEQYYPCGGPGDIQLVTNDEHEAWEKFRALKSPADGERRYDWVDLYDTVEQTIIG